MRFCLTVGVLAVLGGGDILTSYLGMQPVCIFVMKENYLVGENKHLGTWLNLRTEA